MKTILVLGGDGMAGHVIAKYLEQKGHKVFTTSRRSVAPTADFFFDAQSRSMEESFHSIPLLIDY